VRKFRIANALGPLLAFVTDNSPVFEGRPVGSGETGPTGLAVPARMARTAIWDDVDAARSMVAPLTFDEGFGFHSYAASILQAPAIFTVEDDEGAQGVAGGGGGERDVAGAGATGGDTDNAGGAGAGGANGGGKRSAWQGMRPFTDALAGRALDRTAIEHVLSLFFFDVRFKTYVEIRMADSLPIDYALAFATLIKGLFYSEDNLQGIEGLFAPPGHPETLDAAAVAHAKAALREEGYSAVVYGRPATEWLDALVGMAQHALDEDERSYLEPLAKLVAARTTLIDGAAVSL
jgi:glutamate--cysteine ligase